ncbi:MAG TPA: gephyrin-like molybdotransferase Glp [Solirubrobacteraceae bacterium]|jgi:molybdopterin molybdotransferase|nr:gephyrin-like molybdotransferase Glp [Solirubrobacteraceae bacterium]
MASGLLEIEDARRLVLGAVTPLTPEPVELRAALGRALGEDVSAEQPVPAFDNSAMDGFAVRAEDVAAAGGASAVVLGIVDESRAGEPARATLTAGQAIAISTGAMLPAGADAVVPLEDAHQQDGRVEVRSAVPAGRHVRRAGEDVRAGQAVLTRGGLLGAAELGVLASLGRTSVQCAPRPRLSVLASGDELTTTGEPLRAGAVHDSNSLTIGGLARLAGAEVARSAVVADDPNATAEALAAAVRDVDVAVICGGVSVGVHDHVRPSLEALGARAVFWGLALRPGHPTWFGTLGSTLVFGLPGNPVSAMVTFVLLVRPALRALLGLPAQAPRLTAVMERDYDKPAGRAHAVRCRITAREDGWHAEPTGHQGSHVLTSMLAADALALIPSETVAVRAGERVEIEPLRSWLGAAA